MKMNILKKKFSILELYNIQKTKLFACMICVLAFGINIANAQVGMMGNNPDKSAILDLSNTNKGLLLPQISLNSLTDKTSIAGGNPATSLMVYNTNPSLTGGTGFYYWDSSSWKKITITGEGGDNLGNHTATQNLNMSAKDITAAANITATGKTTTNTAQISKGINNAAPLPGYIATAADASGNVNWIAPTAQAGSISGVYEVIGTVTTSIEAGNTANLTQPSDMTFTLTKSSYVLVTYSALPLPTTVGLPTQGSIDLMLNGTKQISSYYSATDSPIGTNGSLNRLGNYSTAQKMLSLEPGTYSFNVQAKCWYNGVRFNIIPTTYAGAEIPGDSDAMTTRITAIVFNK